MPDHGDEKVRPLWTDAELDAALSALHDDRHADERAMRNIRAQVLAVADAERAADADSPSASGWARRIAAGTARRTRRTSWGLRAAAAVAVLALTSQLVPFGGPRVQATALAAQTLNKAARLVAATPDATVGPDQYRYIATHGLYLSAGGGPGSVPPEPPVGVLEERTTETWMPATWQQEWLRRKTIGTIRLLVGTEAHARAARLLDRSLYGGGEWRARCGEFYRVPAIRPDEPCPAGPQDAGGWQNPTPQWIAGLPRDPGDLYQRLSEDSLPNDRGNMEILVTAADALRTGRLPADLRAALYQALTYVPGLDVTDAVANLDGAKGTALGMTDKNGIRQEIIVDPATGRFIGEREVVTRTDDLGLAPGTVIGFTSLKTAVVDRRGARPGR